MRMPSGPALSVILVTPDSYASIRKVIRHLRAQNVRDQLELIIVAPARNALMLVESELTGFASYRVVEVGRIESGGGMLGCGVRAASAPLVVYVEEHSFPAPGWAEALIRAFDGPWAAVGSAVRNANPSNAISWATLFLEFGAWVPPAVAGERGLLPSHQTSYRRSLLLEYGAALDDLLETESTLQMALLARGHRLYFEPAAQTDHVNVSRFPDLIAIEFQNYRMFAANRAAHARWSLRRRVLYIVGGPLIPVVRLYRTLRELHRCGQLTVRGPQLLFPLAVGVIAGAVGEIVGYTFGAGAAAQNRLTFELERLRHVTETDREEVTTG